LARANVSSGINGIQEEHGNRQVAATFELPFSGNIKDGVCGLSRVGKRILGREVRLMLLPFLRRSA